MKTILLSLVWIGAGAFLLFISVIVKQALEPNSLGVTSLPVGQKAASLSCPSREEQERVLHMVTTTPAHPALVAHTHEFRRELITVSRGLSLLCIIYFASFPSLFLLTVLPVIEEKEWDLNLVTNTPSHPITRTQEFRRELITMSSGLYLLYCFYDDWSSW